MADIPIAAPTLPAPAAANAPVQFGASGSDTGFTPDGSSSEQDTTLNGGSDSSADSSSPSSSSLIVTSGASRANYADNVTTMNDAIGNLSQNGIIATPNKDVTPAQTAAATAAGWQPASSTITTNPDGTSTHTTTAAGAPPVDDGSTDGDGTGGDSSSAFDPGVKSQFDSALSSLNDQITSAKSTLATALSTMQNDPASQAAVNQILAKYDQQITLMENKNASALGSLQEDAARSGSMQYANGMYTSFMSEEQDAASQRLSDLITAESSAVLTAQQAYQKGDLAAFNAASDQLDKLTTEKTDTLNKLLTATNNAVKAQQAQAKIDAANAKQKISDNIRVSTANADAVASALSSSGITDPDKKKAYIDAMATQLGISDPSYLESAVAKSSLSRSNTASEINARNNKAPAGAAKGGTDGAYTYTAADISRYTSLMNTGGTGPDGTKYSVRDSDGYVDPKAYIASYQDWMNNGGTPKGFLKLFPSTNVNPSAYSTLPKALQPKAASTGSSYQVN